MSNPIYVRAGSARPIASAPARPLLRRGAFLLAMLALPLLLAACAGPALNDSERTAVSLPAVMRVADATQAAGDLHGAASLYRRAHTLAPTEPDPLIALGGTLIDLGTYGEAAEAFRKALATQPENKIALRGLANAYIALDRPRLALAHLDQLLVIEPSNVQALNNRGVALDLLEEHRSAQASYRTGLDIAPENASLRNNLALSLALSGEYGQAIALLQTAAGEPGAAIRTRQNLALIYGLAGQRDRAAEIAGADLDPKAVENNLAYYATLRSRIERIRAGNEPGDNPVTLPTQRR
ncbi:MAG: tetratricopeptide repeat protein [Rhodospirillales bacterium]|nr:tetratricopeptide repeat protein [Rhodospirillales bacterium]